MDVTTTITVERGACAVEVEIRARVNGRYIPASWLAPAEGGEIDDLDAVADDGLPIELTDAEREEAEEAVYEAFESARQDDYPDPEDY